MVLLILAIGALIFSVIVMVAACFSDGYGDAPFWWFVGGFWGVIGSIASIIHLAS